MGCYLPWYNESMKKVKVKKLKKLPKNTDKQTKDRVEILLEDVNSNFKAFGEALDFTREIMKEEFSGLGKKVDKNTEAIGGLRLDVYGIRMQLDEVNAEISSIKDEITELKLTLSNKGDIKKISNLEKRVFKMENFLQIKFETTK